MDKTELGLLVTDDTTSDSTTRIARLLRFGIASFSKIVLLLVQNHCSANNRSRSGQLNDRILKFEFCDVARTTANVS